MCCSIQFRRLCAGLAIIELMLRLNWVGFERFFASVVLRYPQAPSVSAHTTSSMHSKFGSGGGFDCLESSEYLLSREVTRSSSRAALSFIRPGRWGLLFPVVHVYNMLYCITLCYVCFIRHIAVCLSYYIFALAFLSTQLWTWGRTGVASSPLSFATLRYHAAC